MVGIQKWDSSDVGASVLLELVYRFLTVFIKGSMYEEHYGHSRT